MMENYKHTTVLLDEAVNGLNIRPDGIYIDEMCIRDRICIELYVLRIF